LADLPLLTCETKDLARTNIQDGTESGRVGALARQWIAMDDHIRGALEFAKQVLPAGSRNLRRTKAT
jgi:hypothetical protein